MSRIIQKETIHTNVFLKDLEKWEEKGVFNYRKKVFAELLEPWMEAVFLFVLMYTVLNYLWAFVATIIPETFSENIQLYIALGIYLVITAVFAGILAKKKLKSFVRINRGEVGHKKQPYYRAVNVFVILSLIIALALLCVIYFVFIKDFDNFNLENVSNVQPFVFASVYPFLYYLFTSFALKRLQKDVCPVCGRFDSLEMEKVSGDYGKNKQGTQHVQVKETQKVGSVNTIAHYSNGSTQVVSSQPIYGSVVVDEYDLEYGTKMYDYVYFCKYCSLHQEGTSEKKYQQRLR